MRDCSGNARSGVPPQPYLRPAYDGNKLRAIEVWGLKMWEGIKLAAERPRPAA